MTDDPHAPDVLDPVADRDDVARDDVARDDVADPMRAPARASAVEPVKTICPYLLSADGAWRSSTAAREHRCTAVSPPAPLAAEKQRRLCLTVSHGACATYVAATEARGSAHRDAGPRRPVTRSTPVVLDHGRLAVAIPAMSRSPSLGQAVLVALLAVAFAAVLLARLAAGPGSAPGGNAPQGSAGATPVSSALAVVPSHAATPKPSARANSTPKPTTVPSPTLVPTEVSPSPSGGDHPTSYTVKRGDTLSGIAATYGTTVKKLAALNKIIDPSKLRVGQVLQLP
jgi:LysM repeat protein